MKSLLLSFSIWLTALSLSAQISPFIHVDQFGYLPASTKVAVLSDPQVGYNADLSYSPANTLEVRRADDEAVVLTVSPIAWQGGAVDTTAGDRGWWLDFSDLTTPGSYYIYDAVAGQRSATFEVGEQVYNEVLRHAGRMFYYNRCNAPKEVPYAEADWADADNFVQDTACRYVYAPNDASLARDLTGGWFDAGDYNKYTTFASEAVHLLLSAYEANPQAFGDDWNIPESGNGLPDILDEVAWELRWLLKMTNPDGSVIQKMGSTDYVTNVSSPPSVNTQQRYYGPTCSSAAIAAAGMFAHAAVVYSAFDSQSELVAQLESAAQSTWSYILPNLQAADLDTDCDDGSITAGDADNTVIEQQQEALTAACYLFIHFGHSNYSQYVATHVADVPPLSDLFWDAYKNVQQDALLRYATHPDADATAAQAILTSATTAVSNNWHDFIGFSTADLYRAHMPRYSYHWGSTRPKAGYAIVNLQLEQYGISPDMTDSYLLKAEEQLHYFHGVNPMGLVMLSNMYGYGGDRCVNEIFHTWFNDGTPYDNVLTSPYGPPPGYLTGGPNAYFTGTATLSPPHGQPAQKSYLEFNSDWPDNSWEITEPAIYYQANYIRLLSAFASASSATSVTSPVPTSTVAAYPNPTTGSVQVNGVAIGATLSLYDMAGRCLVRMKAHDSTVSLDLSKYTSGIYRLHIESKEGEVEVLSIVRR